MTILSAGGTALPAPVSISVGKQIIWSSNTGRGTDGTMMGDVIAQKKTISVKWEFLTGKEVDLIESKCVAGFFPVTFFDKTENATITSYRGDIAEEQLGMLSGEMWYRSVSLEIVQK